MTTLSRFLLVTLVWTYGNQSRSFFDELGECLSLWLGHRFRTHVDIRAWIRGRALPTIPSSSPVTIQVNTSTATSRCRPSILTPKPKSNWRKRKKSPLPSESNPWMSITWTQTNLAAKLRSFGRPLSDLKLKSTILRKDKRGRTTISKSSRKDRKKLYEGGWEVVRAEHLQAFWKEKYDEWLKRP